MPNIAQISAKYRAPLHIRKVGWPTTSKTFRNQRDAADWARRTEDEMVRGVFIQRAPSERLTFENALDRYLKEVSVTKSAFTQRGETSKAKQLKSKLGKYSLAAITPDLVADYRDQRLEEGKKPNTVRLELALLGHLFTVAIQEWRIGLAYNPVANIRKPSPGEGRDRSLSDAEETKLIEAVNKCSNPMLGWAGLCVPLLRQVCARLRSCLYGALRLICNDASLV